MAKKAAPKKGKPKTLKAGKPAKAKAAKPRLVKNGKPVAPKKPPAPRNRALPGMEHVRYRELDAFCEGIADSNEKLSEATADRKGYISGALEAMRKRGCLVYKHDGVELLFVPGDAKLRVRQTKDGGDGADVPAGGSVAGEAAPPDGDQFGGDDDNQDANDAGDLD